MGGTADIYICAASTHRARMPIRRQKKRRGLEHKTAGRRDSTNHFTRKVAKTGDSPVTCLASLVRGVARMSHPSFPG
jgi:hypothetical protein